MPEIIYYTGIGAKKSGMHTPKEFTKIMNAQFGIDCSTHLAKQKIPSCKNYKKMLNKSLKLNSSNSNKKLLKKISTQARNLYVNCDRQVKKSLKRSKSCNLDEYIEYSGAEKKNK
jgi:hypothetical protein